MTDSISNTGDKSAFAYLPSEVCDMIAWELDGINATKLTRLSKLMHNRFAGRAFYVVIFTNDGRAENLREQVNSYIATWANVNEDEDEDDDEDAEEEKKSRGINEARTYARRVCLSTFVDDSEDAELPRIIDDVIRNTPHLKQLCIELDEESNGAGFRSALSTLREGRPDIVPWNVRYLDVVASQQVTLSIIENFSSLEVFVGSSNGFDLLNNRWTVLQLLADRHPGLRGIKVNDRQIPYDEDTIQQAYAKLGIILQRFPRLECVTIDAPRFESERVNLSQCSVLFTTWTQRLCLGLQNHSSMRRLVITMEREALAFTKELTYEDGDQGADKVDKYLAGLIKEIGRHAPGLDSIHIELAPDRDGMYSTYAAVWNDGELSVKFSAGKDELLMHGFLANLVNVKIWEHRAS